MNWKEALGVLGTVFGILGIIYGFTRNKHTDDEAQGRQSGTILTELGFIKSGVEDIKTEQREQRKWNMEINTRLAAVEASAKQAHRRIDELGGRHVE